MTAIIGPRAHGKTVILAVAKPIWLVLTGRVHFPVFVSDNQDLSKERVVAIMCEFLYNTRIINDFGEQLKNGIGEETDFNIKTGARFLALGYKQPIRGKLNGRYRPDYILVDDFEGHSAFSKKIAKNKLEYIREEAFGALAKKGGLVVWLGNLTHTDSALAYFVACCDKETENRQIRYRKYKAIDDKGRILWAERYTQADLNKIQDAMGTLGFERHYQMKPVVEGILFKYDWLQYFDSGLMSMLKNQPSATFCDPSFSAKGDTKSIITACYLEGKYYFPNIYCRKATINDMLRAMYMIHQQFPRTQLFMEANFWQSIIFEFITPLVEEFGYILPVMGVMNTLKKEERILRLQPLYERRVILHPYPPNADIKLYEEQLTAFPDHPNDDGPDAADGAIQKLKVILNCHVEYESVETRLGTQFGNMW
jgi:predicted phage terminase large subunit-like protein